MTAEGVRSRVIAEVRMLPTGSVVEWGDDTSGDQPLLSDDLLIWAPSIARPLDMHWLWAVTASEPESGMHAMLIVVHPDEEGCWTPAQISQVLGDWVAVHAGRMDITFRYNATFISDLARRMAELGSEAAEAPDPMVESPDGRLHTLVVGGSATTACGLTVTHEWSVFTDTIIITPEMTDDECDWQFDRLCC
ncbi:MAG: hypothetical protein ICV72_11635 [Aldersonia sp.]|nr:hypothetical protein [Aldersonia sp.]